jgi:GLPGLI family protein
MKLNELFIAAFTFLALSSFAQTNGNAGLQVIYSFEFIIDTTERNRPFTEDMALFVNNNMSRYCSAQKIRDDSLFDISSKEADVTGMFVSRGRKANINYEYYHNLSKDTFWITEFVGKTFLVKDYVPVIEWQIGNQHKTILGHACTDATAKFRGRLYHVWFAPDIPISAGPHKLYGLPGLILSAEDTTHEVKYSCKSIDKLNYANSYLAFDYLTSPQKYIVTTNKNLNNFREQATADPIGTLKANTGIDLQPTNSNYIPPKRIIKKANNFIELE